MAFAEDLRLLGFRLTQERRDGARSWSMVRNRFLTYWVHTRERDAGALFTWEFAIGDYMSEYGLQLGSGEQLNLYLFPQTDTVVELDLASVAAAMDQAQAMFAGMNFAGQGI